MTWNWQLSDWPNFTWDASQMVQAERQFLIRSAEFSGAAKHLNKEDYSQLAVHLMSDEAMMTSEIEGEILDRASVQSSIRHQLGLPTDKRRVPAAERGIAELMGDLNRTYAAALTDEALFRWNAMLLTERQNLTDVGRYRTHDTPMQVVSYSRDLYLPEVHFEAPPSKRVPGEMSAFVRWFNDTAPDGKAPLPAITRAGIAHLYFESIHPFEDGNGRMGRALSEKALDQTIGHVTFTALAAVISGRRKAYYQALEDASKDNHINRWLLWFSDIIAEAQNRTTSMVDFLIAKTRFFDQFSSRLNSRQEKVLLRMFAEGPNGFQGGLSAGNYIKISGAPPTTATRDMAELVSKGALSRTGERRYTRYHLVLNGLPLR